MYILSFLSACSFDSTEAFRKPVLCLSLHFLNDNDDDGCLFNHVLSLLWFDTSFIFPHPCLQNPLLFDSHMSCNLTAPFSFIIHSGGLLDLFVS